MNRNLIILISLILILVKLTGYTTVSWWLILLPIYIIPLMFIMLVITGAFIVIRQRKMIDIQELERKRREVVIKDILRQLNEDSIREHNDMVERNRKGRGE